MTHSVQTVRLWLDRIFEHEAGYSDDPQDPGNWTGGKIGVGELKGTKFGIAANTYGHLDIKNLTLDHAAQIYIDDFLGPLWANKYDDGVAFQLLDFAVNSGFGGVKTAIKRLQAAAGLKADGIVGPKTMMKMAQYTEAQLIMLLLSERIYYLTNLDSHWPRFGKGWMRRIANNLRYGAQDSA